MNISTEILHYQDGSSDKVYIVEVNEISGNYIVTTSYGGREAAILTSRIIYQGDSQFQAEYEARKVTRQKTNKGYEPIAKNLKINGYKPKQVSVTQVAVDNSQAATEVIKKAAPTGRKIKL